MFTAVKPFMNSRHKFDESQLRDGAIGLVNVKLDAPKFSGQTKERLSDPRVGAPLREILVEKFTEVFKQNKALVTRLMERWQRLYELKANYTRSRETDKTIKARLGAGLSPKAACSPRCTPEQRELFLVEGDSAAGAAKQARLPFFQEILPLRGKMGNASRASDDAEGQAKVVAGKSTMDIIAQIGYDPTKPDPIAAMRVRGKIIALVDPDPDGDHIANLVLMQIELLEQAKHVYLTCVSIAYKLINKPFSFAKTLA
jgi:DNA gyrase subunit B